MSWYIRSFFGFTFLNSLYFFKYSCTNIFHRRSLNTFYNIVNQLPSALTTSVHEDFMCQGSTHFATSERRKAESHLPKLSLIVTLQVHLFQLGPARYISHHLMHERCRMVHVFLSSLIKYVRQKTDSDAFRNMGLLPIYMRKLINTNINIFAHQTSRKMPSHITKVAIFKRLQEM